MAAFGLAGLLFAQYPKPVPYRDLEPVSKQLTIVVGLTVVGFMAFGLALSFYRNVLFEETLKNMNMQNERLRQKNVLSQGDTEYYKSVQFKDKFAKENLDKLNPGEQVLIIIEEQQKPVTVAGTTLSATEQQEVAFEEMLRQMPVYEHWRLYLLHPEMIEEIKKGL